MVHCLQIVEVEDERRVKKGHDLSFGQESLLQQLGVATFSLASCSPDITILDMMTLNLFSFFFESLSKSYIDFSIKHNLLLS